VLKGDGGYSGKMIHLDPERRYWRWPEADRLKDLAREIKIARLEFGQANESCERFLRLCSLRGSNIPGEPKLAAEFLASIPESEL
jgi:hypothetical protein